MNSLYKSTFIIICLSFSSACVGEGGENRDKDTVVGTGGNINAPEVVRSIKLQATSSITNSEVPEGQSIKFKFCKKSRDAGSTRESCDFWPIPENGGSVFSSNGGIWKEGYNILAYKRFLYAGLYKSLNGQDTLQSNLLEIPVISAEEESQIYARLQRDTPSTGEQEASPENTSAPSGEQTEIPTVVLEFRAVSGGGMPFEVRVAD